MGLITFPIAAEVGFSSSGAGAFGTVALLGLTSLSAAQVVGTDLAFGLVFSVIGTGVHMVGGTYDSALLDQASHRRRLRSPGRQRRSPKDPQPPTPLRPVLWLLAIGVQFVYQALVHHS